MERSVGELEERLNLVDGAEMYKYRPDYKIK